ncbi:MAG: hypothetical protein RSB85_01250 [Rikenellaceae bacterium]
MKKLLLKFIIFLSILGAIYFGTAIIIHYMVCRPNTFKLDKSKTILVVGSSTTQCAINDTIISKAYNVSFSDEHYKESYAKIKLFLRDNPQIDTVLMGYNFTNSQNDIDGTLYQNDKNGTYHHFNMYNSIFGFNEICSSVKDNPNFIFALVAPRSLEIILSGRSYNRFGAYEYSGRDKLQKDIKIRETKVPDTSSIRDHYQLIYFDKIKKLCKEKDVKLILITTPIYQAYKYIDTAQLNKYYKEHFSDVEWLDYKDFPLADSCYSDIVHLHNKGTIIFSEYLRDSVLTKKPF